MITDNDSGSKRNTWGGPAREATASLLIFTETPELFSSKEAFEAFNAAFKPLKDMGLSDKGFSQLIKAQQNAAAFQRRMMGVTGIGLNAGRSEGTPPTRK